MPGCEAVAATGGGVAGGEGGVGLELEGADRGVLGRVCISRIPSHGYLRSYTRSFSVADSPCMEAPPWTLIFVFGAGEDVRDDVRELERTFGRSDIKGPAAEGGGLEVAVDVAGVVLGN